MLEFQEVVSKKKIESLDSFLDFGKVEAGKKESRQFVIKNPNLDEPVAIRYEVLAWNYQKQEYADLEPDLIISGVPSSIEPGGKAPVTLVFAPKQERMKSLKARIRWFLEVG